MIKRKYISLLGIEIEKSYVSESDADKKMAALVEQYGGWVQNRNGVWWDYQGRPWRYARIIRTTEAIKELVDNDSKINQ